MVLDGVLIKERCGAIGGTTPFPVINCLQTRAKVLYARYIIPCAGTAHLAQFFAIGRVGERDVRAARVGDVAGQVEVVVADGQGLVVVLRHVAVQVVGVGRCAGGKLEALGGVARIGYVGQAVGPGSIPVGVRELVYDAKGARGGGQAPPGIGFDIAVQVVSDAAF